MAKIIFVALFCLLSAALVKAAFNKEEVIKKFMATADECSTEVGATPADVDEMIKTQAATSREGKCLRACIMKKYKVMDSNGKFDKAVALEHAQNYSDGDAEKMKIATDIVNNCSGINVSDDNCDAAVEYLACVKEQAKAHGIEKFEI